MTNSPLNVAGIAIACAVPVATFLATAGLMSLPHNTKGIDVVQGRDLFRAHCGSCHFVKEGFPAHHGPNLHEIGRTGAQRRPDMSAPAYLLESVLQPAAFVAPSSRPGMPQNVAADLDPDQLRNIIGFLAGRGADPDYDEIAALEIPDRRAPSSSETVVRRADMEQAVELMQTSAGCLKCHSRYPTPESNVLAPGIFQVGLSDPRLVRESISDPNRAIKEGYRSVNVVLQNGKVLNGRLLTRTHEYLLLCMWNQAGRLDIRRISINDIEHEDGCLRIEESEFSIMPTDFGRSLTNHELENIVTLIRQLN